MSEQVNEIYKLIKQLTEGERYLLDSRLNKPLKENKINYCQFCKCRLQMDIEKQHKTCWDCHYEGKDNT